MLGEKVCLWVAPKQQPENVLYFDPRWGRIERHAYRYPHHLMARDRNACRELFLLKLSLQTSTDYLYTEKKGYENVFAF